MKKAATLMLILSLCVSMSVGNVAYADEIIMDATNDVASLPQEAPTEETPAEEVLDTVPVVEVTEELPDVSPEEETSTEEEPTETPAPTEAPVEEAPVETPIEVVDEEPLETPEEDTTDLGEGLVVPMPPSEPETVTTEGSTEFVTTIVPTVVDVTIPLNVEIFINPNEADGFVYGAIEVQNHTLAPVVVSIKEFSMTSVPFDYCITPDNLPAGLSWDNLTISETKKYFALGVCPITFNNKYWQELFVDDYVYARDGFSQTKLGVISGGASAYLGLKSFYGKAFTEEKSFRFSATFVVELKR